MQSLVKGVKCSPADTAMSGAYARIHACVCITGARLGRSPGRPLAGGDRAGPLTLTLVALALTLNLTRTQTQTQTRTLTLTRFARGRRSALTTSSAGGAAPTGAIAARLRRRSGAECYSRRRRPRAESRSSTARPRRLAWRRLRNLRIAPLLQAASSARGAARRWEEAAAAAAATATARPRLAGRRLRPPSRGRVRAAGTPSWRR